jgi:hypothetical protein
VAVSVFADAIWLDELAVGATFASPKSKTLAWPRLVTKTDRPWTQKAISGIAAFLGGASCVPRRMERLTAS